MDFLYRLANTPAGRFLTSWIFAHMSFIIPVRRLRETKTLLAFHHPQPAHPFHVIILPKKDIRSFMDLEPSEPFLADLIKVTRSLVTEYHLLAYRLVVNGGEYQEFPRLHFHLVSEFPARDPLSPDP